MKLVKSIFLCALVGLAFSSCKEKDNLTMVITHEIRLPEPLLEIADASVTYTDQSGTKTESIPNGRFSHTTSFYWEGTDAIEKGIDNKFNQVTVTLKLKVPESELVEGAQLLNDPTAYYGYSYTMTRNYEKDNFWTSSNQSSKNTVSDSKKFVFSDAQMGYNYSVDEQLSLLKKQAREPHYDFTISKAGTSLNINVEFNIGQSQNGKAQLRQVPFDY